MHPYICLLMSQSQKWVYYLNEERQMRLLLCLGMRNGEDVGLALEPAVIREAKVARLTADRRTDLAAAMDDIFS